MSEANRDLEQQKGQQTGDQGAEGEQQTQTGDQGQQQQQQQRAPRKTVEQQINELRAAKDTEIADLRKQMETLQNEQAGDVVLSQAAEELRVIDAIEDPAEQAKAARDLSVRLARGLSSTRKVQESDTRFANEQGARAQALQIIVDSGGGDFEPLRARIAAAKTPREQEIIAKEIRAELMLEQAKKGGGGQTGNGNQHVDEGRGAGTRTALLDEINSLDIEDPEFDKKSQAIERKLQAQKRGVGAR